MRSTELSQALLRIIPKHAASFSIEHNANKDVYETVAEHTQFIAEMSGTESWISGAEKEKAIRDGELWTCRWYPDTPIGFFEIWASSLEAILTELDRLTSMPETPQ